MIQLWKLKRELQRVRQQLSGWVSSIYEPILRYNHQRWFEAQASMRPGGQKPAQRLAIYLLYQPSGVSQSTVEACQHLATAGFGVLIVSNCVVSSSDAQRLYPWVVGVLERPNFGYDFGGYRDGILWASKQGWPTENLLLVNDSIWFPATATNGTEWLDALVDAPADFCGAVELSGRRSEAQLANAKAPFFGSFFLLFKSRALLHPSFMQFWMQYKMTSNKYATIRRGERRISALMRSAGMQTHAAFHRGMFDCWVEQSNAAQLKAILADLLTMDRVLANRKLQLLYRYTDSSSWTHEAQLLIFDITDIQNLLVTAPIACLTEFGIPIIKKANTNENFQALQSIESAYSSGRVRLTKTVGIEIGQKTSGG